MPSAPSSILIPVGCLTMDSIHLYVHELIMESTPAHEPSDKYWVGVRNSIEEDEDLQENFREKLASELVSDTAGRTASQPRPSIWEVYMNVGSDSDEEKRLNQSLYQAGRKFLEELKGTDPELTLPRRFVKPTSSAVAYFVKAAEQIQVLRREIPKHERLHPASVGTKYDCKRLSDILKTYTANNGDELKRRASLGERRARRRASKLSQSQGVHESPERPVDTSDSVPSRGSLPHGFRGSNPASVHRDHPSSLPRRSSFPNSRTSVDTDLRESVLRANLHPSLSSREPYETRRGRYGPPPVVQQVRPVFISTPETTRERAPHHQGREDSPPGRVHYEYGGSRTFRTGPRIPAGKVYVVQERRFPEIDPRRDTSVSSRSSREASPEEYGTYACITPAKSQRRSKGRWSMPSVSPPVSRSRAASPPVSFFVSYLDIPHKFYEGCVRAMGTAMGYDTRVTHKASVLGSAIRDNMILGLTWNTAEQREHRSRHQGLVFAKERPSIPSATAERLEEAARQLLLADGVATDRLKHPAYRALYYHTALGTVIADYINGDPWIEHVLLSQAQSPSERPWAYWTPPPTPTNSSSSRCRVFSL